MASHHCFNLHFLNDGFGRISFHMLISPMCIFFGEMSLGVLHILNWIVCLPIVEFKSSLYIFNRKLFQI